MKYDSLLKIFTANKGKGNWMAQPVLEGGFVFATDAHSVIRVPIEVLGQSYNTNVYAANFNMVLELSVFTESKSVTRLQLEKVLSKFSKEYVKKECETCEGEGQIECNLGHMHDCETCKGEGSVANLDVEMIYPKDNAVIKIGKVYLAPFYLEKLVKVMNELGEIKAGYIGGLNLPTKHQIFVIKEAYIILMPVDISDQDHENYQIVDYYTQEKVDANPY